MPQATSREPLSALVAARVTEFARACKAGARAVALYPAGHPAVTASLGRVVDAAGRATERGPLTLAVLPGALIVDDRAPARPDAAIGELAALLHEHLIGELCLLSGGDADAWSAFLRLLATPSPELRAAGGIGRLWGASGYGHVRLREVDYAEVLREREEGIAAAWDTILRNCLEGDAVGLDADAIRALLEIAQDEERLARLVADLDARAGAAGGGRPTVDALLHLLRRIAEAALAQAPDRIDAMLANMAAASAQLSADVMLGVLAHRYDAPAPGSLNVVDAVATRMTDGSASGFVARSILAEGGATERLAEAFQALVPDADRRQRLLGMARDEVAAGPLGGDDSFPDLWQRATDLLTSYRDEPFVSEAYAAELSGARRHAEDVDRIDDDPPDRVAGWLSTVGDSSIRARDVDLLLDLLRLEVDPDRWRDLLDPVQAHLEDLVLLGDFEAAIPLAAALSSRAGAEGDDARRAAAGDVLDRLGRGPLMTHLVAHLRTVDDDGFDAAGRLVATIGPRLIPPLAEALAIEERGRAFRRLTDLLVRFGSAGRAAADELKSSANPAVRRTAIYLLREFGGTDALPELAALLDDAEPNVQRDAVRALALIGTEEAYATLQQALASGTPRQREAIVGALGSMRDERAVPLFCHMVASDSYRRRMPSAYLAAVDGLAALGGRESVAALRQALHQGDWWSPLRTRTLRRAVAGALARIGTPDASDALKAASVTGSPGVRAVARELLARTPPPIREPRGGRRR
jgi:hypothetical protein